jgi:serine/threonine-protein kinase
MVDGCTAPAPQAPAAPVRGLAWLGFEAPVKFQLLRVLVGRLVAIKVLHEHGAGFLERFRREARVLARLAHPSIVAVHELDTSGDRAYLAMDYVDGGSLAVARLEPRALARALRGVVDALAHAHERGVVHRDVKPEHVLLDRRGKAWLCDFGVALEHGDACNAGHGGTPLTMSPEQARGGRVGPQSDQFSLGVTLYRQLTGVWPFRGRALGDVLAAIQRAEPPRPRALDPRIPPALERLVLRCLAKEPSRRFASMRELGDELERFLAPRPLYARLLPALARTVRRAPIPTTRHRIHPEDHP